MLAVIKHVVDDNIICLSATQLMHEPAHGARTSSTAAAAQNCQLFFPELWPQQARAELN